MSATASQSAHSAGAKSQVEVDHVSFAWPDGTSVFADLSAAFPPGRTGLIGANGCGKTTLLRLIAGELTPQRGTVRVRGALAWLRQGHRRGRGATVADMLGIAGVRRALRAIEAGSTDPADFDAVGEQWDVEARAAALLARIGLKDEDEGALLDRPADSLSGGEEARVALAGIRLRRPDVTLLDEPTNDLDGSARRALYADVDAWEGALIVVSHDRELLEHVDQIVDLDARVPRSFGGPFSAYERWREVGQQAAEHRLRDARAREQQARRQAAAEQQRRQQRERAARREVRRGNVSKGAQHFLRNRSERRAAGKDEVHARALERSARDVRMADAAARRPDEVRIDMPGTRLPSAKRVAEIAVGDVALAVVGPARVRIDGDNGVGKTTLLRVLSGEETAWSERVFASPPRLALAPTVPLGVVSQASDELAGAPDALEALRGAARERSPREARALLARFLVGEQAAVRPLGSLSGGERFRVALARVLFAEPTPQLLLLDEPTNNLDMASTAHLAEALEGYRGALVVVTHDEWLARHLRVDTVWRLRRGPEGTVIERPQPATGA